MRSLIRSKLTLTVVALVMVIALSIPLAVLTISLGAAHAATQTHTLRAASSSKNNPLCSKLGKSLQASQGAQMFCFGPQSTSSAQAQSTSKTLASSKPSFGSNVDAANPQEDVTPSGVQVHGQSETSVASAGPYVVEAWNDGTGFFAPCGSLMNKEELTGFGFSNDGGKTFADLGGLPNSNCATSLIEGDPSVEAYTVGGSTYFYIGSIFIPFNVPENALSVTACKVNGSGATATLACGQPIVAAISSDCETFDGFTFCSFLDKDFLSIDPVRGRLYMSYTEFGPSSGFSGVVELAVCDLSSPASPTCHNGSDGSITGAGAPAAPYLVVAPGDPNFCENEGAYPAVDPKTGAVYVAYEHDWFSGLFNCGGETTQNVMNYIPFSCLTLTPTSPCAGPTATQAVNITSLEAAFIPGYNRFPMNDFPRVAVSDPAGTVSMVWNDARQHGTGDIFLQSFNLGSLTPVQSQPVQINSRNDSGGWHFLPAVRNAGGQGNLNVSFYSRSSANTALTNVFASLKVDPRTTSTPTRGDTQITTGSSDWNGVSSIIVPNFGDYTDNYFVGTTLYVAWSDGRLGLPQPFEDHVSVH
jgi:hypothetical protein